MTIQAPDDLDGAGPDGSRCLAVGRAAEEIGAALAAGREADIEGIIARHPAFEEEIRSLLPALLVLEGADRSGKVQDGSALRHTSTSGTEVPLEIGDFRILREIGRGGMGVVYEALQMSLGRRVALKVLPFAAVLDRRSVERFRNEAQSAAGLYHTHIVPVYAVGCERGIHYYAMQYIDGQSLAELIAELRRRSVPASAAEEGEGGRTLTPAGEALSSERSSGGGSYWRSIARLGSQAADALDHAHEMGIVHRDIKPSNLLLDARGSLWVTDFGLARAQGESGLTLSGDILGTLRYMSPEGALGKRGAVDERTDIYSLGATLYELLTLAPALPGKERREIIEKIAFAEPVAPRRLAPSVPRDLETIILKALSKEPGARYATAREMAADLRRFLEDKPIRAKRPGVLRRAAKWVRRHRALAAAAALVAISTGLAGGLLVRDRIEEMRREFDRLVRRAVESMAIVESREGAGAESARRSEGRDIVLGDDPFLPGSGARERMDGALRDLAAAAHLFPRRPDAPYHRARALALIRREREAIDEASRLLERSPDFVPARTLRAALEERSGDAAAAAADLERARSAPGGSWARSWFEARHAASARRWGDAARAYTELIRSVEEEPYAGFLLETRLGRGLALLEAKDHLAALRDFAAACDRWPRALAPALFLGQTYLAMGEEEAAERWFEGVHEASDLKDEAALEVAGIFNRMEAEGKGGERALAWAERMGPGPVRERARMKILADLWRHDEAARVGEEALARYPEDVLTIAHLAVVYTRVPGGSDRSNHLIESALHRGERNVSVQLLASEVYGMG